MGVTIQPPENVYRKPYEFVSGGAYLGGAVSLIFLPLPALTAYAGIPLLTALAGYRCKQGLRIRRYRRNLRRLSFYGIRQGTVPRARFQMDTDAHPTAADGQAT